MSDHYIFHFSNPWSIRAGVEKYFLSPIFDIHTEIDSAHFADYKYHLAFEN